jgi:uncharacterized protein YndB with AHSA1/START domain
MPWSRSITIERPPSDVWVAFTDLGHVWRASPDVVDCRWVEGDGFAPGSAFEHRRKDGGKEVAARYQVLDVEPWRSYTMASEEGGCRIRRSYRFSHDGPWTKVTMEAEAEPQAWYGRITRRVLLRRLERDAEHLEQAKRHIECTLPPPRDAPAQVEATLDVAT